MSDRETYIAAGIGFGNSRRERGYVAGNPFADQLHLLGLRMRTDSEGQKALLDMLQHPDEGVRSWAAKDCLFFAPECAVPVLEALTQCDGMLGFSASMTLQEWRAGRLG